MPSTDSVLRGSRIPAAAFALIFIVLAFLTGLPYLWGGFACDDYFFLSMVEGDAPYSRWLGFWGGDPNGFQVFKTLWWRDPGAVGSFIRPLASLLLEGEYALFHRNAFGFHAVSLLLHGLTAFAAFLLLRRLSKNTPAAFLAGLMFLVSEDHGMTVAWNATQTDLLGALLLLLALYLHSGSKGDRAWLRLVPANLLFLGSLLSKETAVVYPLMVVLYEYIHAGEAGPSRLRERFRLFLGRWAAWAPSLVLLGLYLMWYRRVSLPMSNLMYTSPFTDPLAYLVQTLTNFPVMVLGQVSLVPIGWVSFYPRLKLPFVLGGLAALALLLWALRPFRGNKALLFCSLAFVLSLLPGLAAEAGDRLLYLPSPFALFVAAALILQIGFLGRKLAPDARHKAGLFAQVWGWYLLMSALIVPLILLFVYPQMWVQGLKSPERIVLQALPEIRKGDYQHVVCLNTPGAFDTFYANDIYRYHAGSYADLRLLSSFYGRAWVRQESDSSLAIKSDAPGWLDNMFARIMRVNPYFEVGRRYDNDLFSATIMAVTPDRKDILEVRFEFHEPLTSPNLLFLFWDDKTVKRWQPARSGQSDWQFLADTSNPFGY